MSFKQFYALSTGLLLSSTQGCVQVDVKRLTYEVLRQQDCRINEPNSFCDRSYSLEYLEYAQIRKEFLIDTETAHFELDFHQKTQASNSRDNTE